MRCTQLWVGAGATDALGCFDFFVFVGDGWWVLDVLEVAELGLDIRDDDGALLVVEPVGSVVPAALRPEPEEQPATTNAETAQAPTVRTRRRETGTDRR